MEKWSATISYLGKHYKVRHLNNKESKGCYKCSFLIEDSYGESFCRYKNLHVFNGKSGFECFGFYYEECMDNPREVTEGLYETTMKVDKDELIKKLCSSDICIYNVKDGSCFDSAPLCLLKLVNSCRVIKK